MDILLELGQNPLRAALILVKYFGLPLFFILFFFGGKILWLNWRQNKYANKINYILLAIDIPRANEQGPRAVENMFDQISGAHSSPNWREKWLGGYLQPKFSLEIISIGGDVQFLIHTPEKFRDLIEASIYAQYPDAEITEVPNYTDDAPQFPSEDYNLWGAEFITVNKDSYPIKTYPAFEDSLSKELKDPMSALIEILASLRKGENVWIQYIITMTGTSWRKKSKAEINKLAGRKSAGKGGIFGLFGDWIGDTIDQIMGNPPAPSKKEDSSISILQTLTPGEIELIKSIESKMNKNAFVVKMRIIYWAPNSIFQKTRAVSATVGAIKQFNSSINALKPESKFTRTKSFVVRNKARYARRQRNILNAYKNRSNSDGVGDGFIFNTEEIATVFHFPVASEITRQAFAPQKVGSKKSSPPNNLPFLNSSIPEIKEKNLFIPLIEEAENEPLFNPEDFNGTGDKVAKKGEPPPNLPIS